MKKFENAFINWLVVSSEDPTKVSLTVKGSLIAAIPMLVVLSQMLRLNWSQDQLALIVEGVSTIVSSFLVLFGLLRKLYYSIYPSNAVTSEDVEEA